MVLFNMVIVHKETRRGSQHLHLCSNENQFHIITACGCFAHYVDLSSGFILFDPLLSRLFSSWYESLRDSKIAMKG
jgi:hypothetical protein